MYSFYYQNAPKKGMVSNTSTSFRSVQDSLNDEFSPRDGEHGGCTVCTTALGMRGAGPAKGSKRVYLLGSVDCIVVSYRRRILPSSAGYI